jgi:hypothetical protein
LTTEWHITARFPKPLTLNSRNVLYVTREDSHDNFKRNVTRLAMKVVGFLFGTPASRIAIASHRSDCMAGCTTSPLCCLLMGLLRGLHLVVQCCSSLVYEEAAGYKFRGAISELELSILKRVDRGLKLLPGGPWSATACRRSAKCRTDLLQI